jgi:hypothetical protein
MAKTRGTTIIPRIKFLRARGVWDDVVPHLSAPTRDIVTGTVLASTWYPFETLVDVIRTADRIVGKGDLALAKEMGRYAATANLSTVFRILVRLATPKTVLAKGASLWSLHHDTGKAVATEDGPGGASYEIRDFGAPDRALCVSLEGWIERCMEITGAKNVEVREEECATKGGPVCRFRGSWKT